MPSCRQCNFYKGTSTIGEFREKIRRLYDSVLNGFSVRLAQKYGIVSLHLWDGDFYFERMSITGEVKKVIDEIKKKKMVSNNDLLHLNSLGILAWEMWKESHYVWEDFCDLLGEKYQVK